MPGHIELRNQGSHNVNRATMAAPTVTNGQGPRPGTGAAGSRSWLKLVGNERSDYLRSPLNNCLRRGAFTCSSDTSTTAPISSSTTKASTLNSLAKMT